MHSATGAAGEGARIATGASALAITGGSAVVWAGVGIGPYEVEWGTEVEWADCHVAALIAMTVGAVSMDGTDKNVGYLMDFENCR